MGQHLSLLFPALPALCTASPAAVGLQHPCCSVCTSARCGDGGVHSALATVELPAWGSLSKRPRFWRGGSRPGRAGGRFAAAGGKSLSIGILIPGRFSAGWFKRGQELNNIWYNIFTVQIRLPCFSFACPGTQRFCSIVHKNISKTLP